MLMLLHPHHCRQPLIPIDIIIIIILPGVPPEIPMQHRQLIHLRRQLGVTIQINKPIRFKLHGKLLVQFVIKILPITTLIIMLLLLLVTMAEMAMVGR